MLGPVLDEVMSWICGTDALMLPSTPVENNGSVGGLIGLLAGCIIEIISYD